MIKFTCILAEQNYDFYFDSIFGATNVQMKK